ncbi:response regulator transcription factor [Puteibacter caeruleilacunae]|nr:response regulator transcription factor [Puteibacter caeruleilacunae]
MEHTCNIILVDDHSLFRNGLKILLNSLGNYKIVAEAANGKEFLNLLDTTQFDIVLLDIDMPVMDGIEAAQKALQLNPAMKIITLSMYGEEDYYYQMVDAGVKGFLLKNSDISEVQEAIACVMDGGSYFSQELLTNLISSLKMAGKTQNGIKELSDREMDVLIRICQGLSNQEIADELFISKRTVDNHRANILAKTNCKNTAHLVVYAIKNGLFEV